MNRWSAGLLGFVVIVAAQAQMQQLSPEFVEVQDTDTLAVKIEGVPYRIQLPAVDAPESVHNPKLLRDVQRTGLDAETLLPLGLAADQWLRDRLQDFKPFRLHADLSYRDKYGRVPGDLLAADGRRLSTLVVEEGYAIPVGDQQGQRQQELQDALARAQRERRGLWGSHPDAFAAWADAAVSAGRR